MTTEETADASATPTFRVVRNDEEQYSIWAVDRELPAGWYAEGAVGSRDECLAHIDAVWTDITPLSVRRARGGPDPR